MEMIRFAHSEYFYLLYLIPILILVYAFMIRKSRRDILGFVQSEMLERLSGAKSNFKVFAKPVILLFALVLMILALANPQVGTKVEEVKQVGIDVFICLDVSLSMKAEDIKPSRLDKAKYEISKLIQKLKGDRLGLIVFSGNAYVQFPLTSDYSAANLFLSAVDVSSVPQPGTNIGAAIELALKSFNEKDQSKKAIVVITDGEDHEGDIEKMAKEAGSKGVSIYAIGLGSAKGEPIPIYNNAGVKVGYKKDKKGEIVLTKLDEKSLINLATLSNGKYYRGSNTSDELDLVYKDLAKIEKTEYGATRITDYEDRYYYFLLPALILLVIEGFISVNKSKVPFISGGNNE